MRSGKCRVLGRRPASLCESVEPKPSKIKDTHWSSKESHGTFPGATITKDYRWGGVAETNTILFSPVLMAGGPKSRCPQDHTRSEGSRGGSFLASSSFWWLL